MALEVSVMPDQGLILIEMVTPKVILFSILTFGSFASPAPTLASLNSFPPPLAVWLVSWHSGAWSPFLGRARALDCRGRVILSAVLLLPSVLRGMSYVLAWERVPPWFDLQGLPCAGKMFLRCVRPML